MKTLSKLSEVARTIVERAPGDLLDLEVRVVRHDGYGYEIRNRDLSPELSLGRVSVGLRALTDRGLAIAATSTLDVEENLDALRASLPAARPTPLSRFSEARLTADGSGHDPAWEAWVAQPARLRDLSAALRDRTFAAAERLGRDMASVEGGVSFSTTWLALATREGEAACKRSSGGAFLQIDAGHYGVSHLHAAPEGDARERVADLGARTLEEIPEREVGPEDLGAGGGEPFPVLLHPRLLESILRNAAGEKFLGASRNAGLSALAAGQAIWDPAITLHDSGVEPHLSTTRPCDDELIPTQATALVQEGRFVSHLWSRRSALEAEGAEVASTGNGYRKPMLVEEPSEAPVRDALSGLVMAPGDTPLAKLLSQMERGLYLFACLGLHGADRARAAFSTTVYDGFAVEGGEIVARLAPGRWNVAGHLFPEEGSPGLLAQVTLSAERERTGSAHLPWLRTHLTVG